MAAYRSVKGHFSPGDRVRYVPTGITGRVIDTIEHYDDGGNPDLLVAPDDDPEGDPFSDKAYLWEAAL